MAKPRKDTRAWWKQRCLDIESSYAAKSERVDILESERYDEAQKTKDLQKELRISDTKYKSRSQRLNRAEDLLGEHAAREQERMVQDLVHNHGMPLVDAMIRVTETLTAFQDRQAVREDILAQEKRVKDRRNGLL